MSRKHGVFDMVLQPGYPDYSGQNGQESMTLFYKHDRSLPFTLPDYDAEYTDFELSEYMDLNYLRLTQRKIQPNDSGDYLLITLVYAGSNPGFESDRVTYDECELDGDDEQIPLEQLENYRTRWNYRLLTKTPNFVGTPPQWYYGAKNTVIPSGDQEFWKWIKPGDQVPEGWYEFTSETKPGVENKLGGSHTVLRTRRALSKNAFQRDMANDYTKQPPPDTFSLKGEWLRGVSKIRKEGSYWVCTNTYMNAKEIDKDLYPK